MLWQLSLRSTDVKDLAIWTIGNPHLNIQFERRTQGKLKLDSWVDVSLLDQRLNPVQDVCSRGFHLPEDGKGLEFTVGNIKFQPGSSGAFLSAHGHRRTRVAGAGDLLALAAPINALTAFLSPSGER